MKRLIISIFLLASPIFAAASTQWYLLNQQTYRCVLATSAAEDSGNAWLASPYAVRRFMRGSSYFHYLGTQISHSSDGMHAKIEGVRHAYAYSFNFFTTRQACESYKADKGLDSNTLNELK